MIKKLLSMLVGVTVLLTPFAFSVPTGSASGAYTTSYGIQTN